MTHYDVTRILHFVGLALWLGSTLGAALLAAFAASAGINASAPARRVLRGVSTPAMILAWIGGLGMLIPQFSALYAHAGWMHGKLFLVFAASGLTGVISGTLGKVETADASAVPERKLRAMAIALLSIVLLVVTLAVAKPGS